MAAQFYRADGARAPIDLAGKAEHVLMASSQTGGLAGNQIGAARAVRHTDRVKGRFNIPAGT
jgi:hypothetical protein